MGLEFKTWWGKENPYNRSSAEKKSHCFIVPPLRSSRLIRTNTVLQFCYWFWLTPICNNVCVLIQRWKNPFRKPGLEGYYIQLPSLREFSESNSLSDAWYEPMCRTNSSRPMLHSSRPLTSGNLSTSMISRNSNSPTAQFNQSLTWVIFHRRGSVRLRRIIYIDYISRRRN